jgi:hypothetical protein
MAAVNVTLNGILRIKPRSFRAGCSSLLSCSIFRIINIKPLRTPPVSCGAVFGLSWGLIAMLVRGLRMLLSAGGVFLAFSMVTFAMMFSGGTMCLGSILMMLGGLVVFVSCHNAQRSPRSAPGAALPD